MSIPNPFSYFVAKTSTYTIGAYTFTQNVPRTVPDAFWTSSNAGELSGHLYRDEIDAYDYAGNEISAQDAVILLGNYMAAVAQGEDSYVGPAVTIQPAIKKLVVQPVVERDVLPASTLVVHAENIMWLAGQTFLTVIDDTSPTTACANVSCDALSWITLDVGAILTLYNAAKDFVRVELPDGQKIFVQPRAELHVIKLSDTSYACHLEHGPGAIDMMQHFVTAGATSPGGWRGVGSGGSVNWGVYTSGYIGAVALNGPSTPGQAFRIETGAYIIQPGCALYISAGFRTDILWTDTADDSNFWIGLGLPSGSSVSRFLGVRYSATDGGIVGAAGTTGTISTSSWARPMAAATSKVFGCILRSDWADAKWYEGTDEIGTITPFPSLSVMQPLALMEKTTGSTAHGMAIDFMKLQMTR